MASFRSVLSKFPRFSTPTVPEKLKNGRLHRIGLYFRGILEDYKAVGVETWQDMKERPIKSGIILSSLAGTIYFAKHNPDERSFRTQLLNNVTELATVGDPIRNPTTENHIQTIVTYYNRGQVRHLNLGVLSLMWVDRFDREVDLFEAQASPLKVGWMDLPERVLDIGILDRWLWLEKAMIEYDVNPNEWQEKPQEQVISLKF